MGTRLGNNTPRQAEMIRRIREDEVVGRGTGSPIDSVYDDFSLRWLLRDVDTDEAVNVARDMHRKLQAVTNLLWGD